MEQSVVGEETVLISRCSMQWWPCPVNKYGYPVLTLLNENNLAFILLHRYWTGTHRTTINDSHLTAVRKVGSAVTKSGVAVSSSWINYEKSAEARLLILFLIQSIYRAKIIIYEI